MHERRRAGACRARGRCAERRSANHGSRRRGHPLTDHDEIYALRYATMTGRQPHQNYLLPDVHNEGTDLGYFVWLIRGEAGDILVNTGFN